jgi:hypothetical protein
MNGNLNDRSFGERPDFYLGSFDTAPVHWGGSPRRCWVIDRPRVVKTGRELWRVRVDPPIPTYEEDLSIRGLIGEWILAERNSSERLEDVREGRNVAVNVYGYNDPLAHEKAVFDSVDLTHEYIGEVKLTPEAFPESPDPTAAWERDLERIRRFIHEHGHSRVPERYYDEAGTRLDTVVGDIRWHHAGRGGWSEGPYPGVDYAADLAGLEGWTWELEDAAELARLRAARYQAPLIRVLGLREGTDETDYIRTVTSALRGSDKPPWPATRELIADKGIDVQDAAVVDLIPIRHNIGYLVSLVEPAMRVFSFYLGIVGDPAEPKMWSDLAYIAEWHELTTDEVRNRYGKELDVARELLEDVRAFRPNDP